MSGLPDKKKSLPGKNRKTVLHDCIIKLKNTANLAFAVLMHKSIT